MAALTHTTLRRAGKALVLALVGAVGLSIVPVLYLRFMPPPTSAFMLRKSIANLVSRQDAPIRYHWTGWTQISPSMRVAVVAAEDQKFPHHWGFDFESIAEAIEDQGPRRRVRGASTITQQVARNLFLWPGRSYIRKGLEAYFTVLLELFWPKRRILEVYLNIAEFGDGTYGVHAASKTFFGKHPSQLTQSEAALLAAVLPNPTRLHANTPSPYVEERAHWIEEQMEQLGGPAYLRTL
ncbi:MAG: monofunctional biosynthetic peptidoglycan transglycosylase [Candidatus Methylomirabilales bacterium]